ncbi:MAG: hypothetical protein R3Y11_11260 [Pseudomonadota bacterium]
MIDRKIKFASVFSPCAVNGRKKRYFHRYKNVLKEGVGLEDGENFFNSFLHSPEKTR